jgi:hypothetical protein
MAYGMEDGAVPGGADSSTRLIAYAAAPHFLPISIPTAHPGLDRRWPPSAFPELDCVRDRLPSHVVAAVEHRAAEIGVGAERVLIASGFMDEDHYVYALARSLWDLNTRPSTVGNAPAVLSRISGFCRPRKSACYHSSLMVRRSSFLHRARRGTSSISSHVTRRHASVLRHRRGLICSSQTKAVPRSQMRRREPCEAAGRVYARDIPTGTFASLPRRCRLYFWVC